MHRLAADQHHFRGFLHRTGKVSVRGDLQIDLTRDNGDDDKDGADAKHSDDDAEGWRHDEIARDQHEAIVCETTRGAPVTVSRLGRIDTVRFFAAAALRINRMAVLKNMSRKLIEALASGHYWAVPHARFALDAGNGHEEVFPGAHYHSVH
ncbi:conserved hypothetical protein [Cupriavidus taiwanensis]|uniref:Uncharacterized protein n=2 Tax=Cupriavidus taiwanensis TaxID=164546 RepID=A0A375JD15_9BURK|nr:conserved hypothetical protein [Cupriavidus taiwanensis]